MNVGEIIGDALAYPLQNVKALVLYVILGIIAAIIGGASLVGLICHRYTRSIQFCSWRCRTTWSNYIYSYIVLD